MSPHTHKNRRPIKALNRGEFCELVSVRNRKAWPSSQLPLEEETDLSHRIEGLRSPLEFSSLSSTIIFQTSVMRVPDSGPMGAGFCHTSKDLS